MTSVLGIFARFPQAGTTKTRLARDTGSKAAAEIYAAFVHDIIDHVSGLDDCRQVIAITPSEPSAMNWFRETACDGFELVFQSDGCLGSRICTFFASQFEQGRGPVVVIGSDSPDLPLSDIKAAFHLLRTADCVIGPAADGGLTLIGLKRLPPHFLDDVRWSSWQTLSDVLMACRKHQLQIELLPVWYDVDSLENLGTLISLQLAGAENAAPCPRTMNTLSKLGLVPDDSTSAAAT